MAFIRVVCGVALLVFVSPAFADDITDAMDAANKAYKAGDLGGAKQQLDLASTLIGQKNAEGFAALLPAPLPGWTAEKAQSNAVGANLFGASSANRTYTNAKGDSVDVSITGDSAMITQFAPALNNPAMAAMMGKIVRVGDQRAIQNADSGDLMILVNTKFLINVTGSGDAASKLAYAQAVNMAKLSKM